MTTTTTQSIFTEEEAANFLRIKPRVLIDERTRGRITPFRIVGNRIRYTRKMLDDYIENHPLNKTDDGQTEATEHPEPATSL